MKIQLFAFAACSQSYQYHTADKPPTPKGFRFEIKIINQKKYLTKLLPKNIIRDSSFNFMGYSFRLSK